MKIVAGLRLIVMVGLDLLVIRIGEKIKFMCSKVQILFLCYETRLQFQYFSSDLLLPAISSCEF